MNDVKNLLFERPVGHIDTVIQKQNYPNPEKSLLSGVSWKEVTLGSFSCNSTQFSVFHFGFLTRE